MSFSKLAYWDRRKKGLRGQIPMTDEERLVDSKIMGKKMQKDYLKKLRKGTDERTKRKGTKKSV